MESLIVPGLIVIVGVLMGISWNSLGKRIDDGNEAQAKSIDKVDSKIDRIQSDIKELHGEVQFIKGRLDPYESHAE